MRILCLRHSYLSDNVYLTVQYAYRKRVQMREHNTHAQFETISISLLNVQSKYDLYTGSGRFEASPGCVPACSATIHHGWIGACSVLREERLGHSYNKSLLFQPFQPCCYTPRRAEPPASALERVCVVSESSRLAVWLEESRALSVTDARGKNNAR